MAELLEIDAAVPLLQVAIAILTDQLDEAAVTPLPVGIARGPAAGKLARAARDIAALADACEVLVRRAKELADN